MSALSLPAPVHSVSGGDTLLAASGATPNGVASGSGTPNGVANGGEGDGKKSSELLQGVIYPPKEIRAIIDKTAIHIAKSPSPQLLEDRIREHQKSDPKFSFLRDGDAFNRYYRYMIEKVKEEGEDAVLALQSAGTTAAATAAGDGGTPGGVGTPVQTQTLSKKDKQLEEPKPFEFVVDLPNVTSLDLDILKLTALFVARRGRSFLQSLSIKEGRNFQFDFLRPTHSLFSYFNRMVESYSKILNPSSELLASLEASQNDSHKWEILEEAKKRGEWERSRREKDKKREAEREKEMLAFAEIDWQDFVVVQTIEFTSTDQTIELPPPTSIKEMERLTLNERKMAADIVEEVGERAQEQQGGQADDGEMEIDMEESDDEEIKDRQKKQADEIARAREVQAKAMGQAGMKIRKDYVPKGLAGKPSGKVATTICPYCKQAIPETEISEHIRIELLDPKWKEQKQLMDQKRSQAAQLLQGADVSASLRQLANARTDLFGTAEDEEARKRQEDEERAARRAKETIIWDGHTASKASTLDTFQNKYNLEDQIQSIHKKHALLPSNSTVVGPQLGDPQNITPAQAAGASTPGGGIAFSGAVISAGPQGPSAPQPLRQQQFQPYPDQFQSFEDQPAFDPSMFNIPPMPSADGLPPAPAGLPGRPPAGIHPSRLAVIGGASPAVPPSVGSPVTGQTRPHEADGAADGEPAKRQRIEKLPTGQLYAEREWIMMHPEPVTISVQLPNLPDKPEWKLNGSIITVEDIPVNFLISTLRERIKNIIDAPLPISRMKIDFGVKTLSNSSTLASVNIGEGDMLSMSIRK